MTKTERFIALARCKGCGGIHDHDYVALYGQFIKVSLSRHCRHVEFIPLEGTRARRSIMPIPERKTNVIKGCALAFVLCLVFWAAFIALVRSVLK